MSLPQQESKPTPLAGIIAFILKPAGMLLAIAIAKTRRVAKKGVCGVSPLY